MPDCNRDRTATKAPHLRLDHSALRFLGRARRFTVTGLREGWAWAPRQWRKVTDDTGVGNPAAATAEKGRKYVDAVTAKIGDFLVELARADAGQLYE